MNPIEAFLTHDESLGVEKTAVDWRSAAVTAGIGVAAPLAAMAVHEGYQEVRGMVGRARGFKRMMEHNPGLKKLPANKTRAMFNTLHNAAPDLAKDPVVASSWVNRMALHDDYVDPRTMADLGSAQQKIQRPGLDFPTAQFTSGMMGEVSDPKHKQLDRQARSAESASTLALNKQKFDHSKAQDIAKGLREQESATQQTAHREKQHEQTMDFLRTQSRAERARNRMYSGR